MLHVVWEFHVKPERQKDFEMHYGAHGHWAMLFRKSPFYDRTVLARDPKVPTRYLLTDIWADLAAIETFKRDFRAEYDALDKHCEKFTTKEQLIGYFEQLEDKRPPLFAAGERDSEATRNR